VQLTTDNIIQLYAPLAGLAILAAWVGALGQKVSDVVRRLGELEKHNETDIVMAVTIGRLEERINTVVTGQGKLDRDMQGVQRTLANMTSKARGIQSFDQDGENDR
jgi:predicted CopG family antitoxin